MGRNQMMANAQQKFARLIWGSGTSSQAQSTWTNSFAGKSGEFRGELIDAKEENGRMSVVLAHHIDKNRLNVPAVFLEAQFAPDSLPTSTKTKLLSAKVGDPITVSGTFQSVYPRFQRGVQDRYFMGMTASAVNFSLITPAVRRVFLILAGLLVAAGILWEIAHK